MTRVTIDVMESSSPERVVEHAEEEDTVVIESAEESLAAKCPLDEEPLSHVEKAEVYDEEDEVEDAEEEIRIKTGPRRASGSGYRTITFKEVVTMTPERRDIKSEANITETTTPEQDRQLCPSIIQIETPEVTTNFTIETPEATATFTINSMEVPAELKEMASHMSTEMMQEMLLQLVQHSQSGNPDAAIVVTPNIAKNYVIDPLDGVEESPIQTKSVVDDETEVEESKVRTPGRNNAGQKPKFGSKKKSRSGRKRIDRRKFSHENPLLGEITCGSPVIGFDGEIISTEFMSPVKMSKHVTVDSPIAFGQVQYISSGDVA